MRVIAGSARGRPLAAPTSGLTRPTADMIKGAIFSMVESAFVRLGGEADWSDVATLDLYAGSGALGIEALSRGSPRADLVERHKGACAAIALNLKRTDLAARARVHCLTVVAALGRPGLLAGSYRLVLLDPPYDEPTVAEVPGWLVAGGLLAEEALVVVEHSRRVELPEEYGRLRRLRRRVHGDTAISLYGPFDDLEPDESDGEEGAG